MARLRRKLSSRVFQVGAGSYSGNVFQGRVKRMRGGFFPGGVIKSLVKTMTKPVMSMVKRKGRAVAGRTARALGKAGIGLAKDIVQRKNVKRSLQSRGKGVLQDIMSAQPRRKPARKAVKKKPAAKGKRRKQKGGGKLLSLVQKTSYKKIGGARKPDIFGNRG